MQMVRYESNAESQGKVAEYQVTSDEGEIMSAFYPPIPRGKEFMEFTATSAQYGPGHKSNIYFVCPNINGYFGVLVTCKNACTRWASITGCTFANKCHFYHAEPGDLMTNLPLRDPEHMGKVDTAMGNSRKFAGLTTWSVAHRATIAASNDAQIKKLVEKHDAQEAERAAIKAQTLRHEQLLLKLSGGQQPARKRARFASPVPVKPASPVESELSPSYSPPSPTFSAISPVEELEQREEEPVAEESHGDAVNEPTTLAEMDHLADAQVMGAAADM
jgi:hypothetical protein